MNNPTDVRNSTPRDTFLYLLGLITLVATAVSFGMLVYQFIDIKFPDPLRYGYGYGYSPRVNYDMIRSALATLIVVFPVFFWVTRVLHKDVMANPEKSDLRIRRWLLYFTVFVAALVLIGDIITLIYSFLNGDFTTSFILKVLTILFIAGATLFYYLSELRGRDYPRRAFQAVIIAAVVFGVGTGFYLIGSPAHQRAIRLDEQKVSHLQMIQSQLIYQWWQQKGSLPNGLEELNDPISSFMVPRDPQTNQPYEYRKTGAKSFQLCATFNKPSLESELSGREDSIAYPEPFLSNWQHGEGKACFDRTIDESLYPVNPGKPVPIR